MYMFGGLQIEVIPSKMVTVPGPLPIFAIIVMTSEVAEHVGRPIEVNAFTTIGRSWVG